MYKTFDGAIAPSMREEQANHGGIVALVIELLTQDLLAS
jgi:hypothetical protein